MKRGSRPYLPWLLLLLGATAQAQDKVKYTHTDALGSIVAVTDSSGRVIERREYESYGAQLLPELRDGPGYAGHVQDAATGLVYMQQRYYDPAIGRFLSVDPVTAYDTGDWRQFNRYAYAFNNPYTFTDPDGRQSKAMGKKIGRWIRALVDNRGDFDKAQAQVDRQNMEDLKIAETIVDFTAVAPVKDAVEVTIKVANREDATGQGAGAISGEVAGQITEKVLDGKIGKGAAEFVGAAVGKTVGDTVEAKVERARAEKSTEELGIADKPRELRDWRDKGGVL